jgi:hypothetical protein
LTRCDHDVGGAEGVATVHEVHLGGEAGEEERFFAGGVAAADDGDRDVAVEGAVAGRAGGDAVAAVVMLLAGDAEERGRGAGGDDHGLGLIGGFAALGFFTGPGEVDGARCDPGELGAEALGLALRCS